MNLEEKVKFTQQTLENVKKSAGEVKKPAKPKKVKNSSSDSESEMSSSSVDSEEAQYVFNLTNQSK